MMEFLDPTLEGLPQGMKQSVRAGSLQGKRVALIDNTKFNSDRLLEKIGDILKREYGVIETRSWRKRNPGVPIEDVEIAEIRATCHAAVGGIGD